MTAARIVIGDTVMVASTGRPGQVVSRSLHPSSGRPRYRVTGAGVGSRWVTKVTLYRSYHLTDFYRHAARASRLAQEAGAVAAAAALIVATAALKGAHASERDTGRELKAADDRYAELLAQLPRPLETPAMSNMKRLHEETHPEEYEARPRVSLVKTPASPHQPMTDRLNRSFRDRLAQQAGFSVPAGAELEAAISRHPAGRGRSEAANEMADKVQAVQDIVAEWSQGSSTPSAAMSAINQVVNS